MYSPPSFIFKRIKNKTAVVDRGCEFRDNYLTGCKINTKYSENIELNCG
jgi:hypothetical protein